MNIQRKFRGELIEIDTDKPLTSFEIIAYDENYVNCKFVVSNLAEAIRWFGELCGKYSKEDGTSILLRGPNNLNVHVKNTVYVNSHWQEVK